MLRQMWRSEKGKKRYIKAKVNRQQTNLINSLLSVVFHLPTSDELTELKMWIPGFNSGHYCYELSLFLFCLSVCLSVWLSVCLSDYLSVCLSDCLSVCLSVWLSVCLTDCLSVWLSVCLTACLSVWLSDCLSASLTVCLSIYLSVFLFVCLWSGSVSIYFSACISLDVCLCLSAYLSVCLSFIHFLTSSFKSYLKIIFTTNSSQRIIYIC